MKICIYSDVHFTKTTSIMNRQGMVYFENLEHLIQSLNWVNKLGTEKNCDAMLCLGDFFDKAQATDEELTALKEIKWNNLKHYFLCGNHESSRNDLRFSTLKVLEDTLNEKYIIDKPELKYDNNTQLVFLPYFKEADRKDLRQYLADLKVDTSKQLIILSHNDIAGIHYGAYESKIGFPIKDIEDAADLYLNGHLHNTEWITKSILNVGSLSAHNFTNDSDRYSYGAWILDTDTLKIEFAENPYSYNFYKIEINDSSDLSKLYKLKNHAVLAIKCNEKYLEELKTVLEDIKDIVDNYRTITIRDIITETGEEQKIDLSVDPLEKFVELSKIKFINDEILLQELMEICR